MITKEKIEIYKYYDGDVDKFFHANKLHKKIMTEEDFFLIIRLIQDIVIVKNGLAAKEFQDKVNRFLQENCDSQETIRLLGLTAP
jgi:hypothetical protein